MVQIPPITNWSVFPQNGDIGYFDDMNVWIGQGNTVISSANASIVKMNEAIDNINNIAENAINAITFDNIAQLKLSSNMGRVDVLGYYTKGDGGGGTFYWDSTSTKADNGGTIIQSTGITAGRWKRIFVGNINVKWFGAKGDGITNDTLAIQKADALGAVLQLDNGTYLSTYKPKNKIIGTGELKYNQYKYMTNSEIQYPFSMNGAIKEGDKTKVVFIGDSITFGHGLNNDEIYTTIMQDRINKYCNTGYTNTASGSTVLNRASGEVGVTNGTSGIIKSSKIISSNGVLSFTGISASKINIRINGTTTTGNLEVYRNSVLVETLSTALVVGDNQLVESSISELLIDGVVQFKAVSGIVEINSLEFENSYKRRTQIITHAKSGYSTQDFVDTKTLLNSELSGIFQGQLLVVALGTNDIYNPSKAVSSLQYKSNILSILDATSSTAVPVVVVPPVPSYSSFVEILEPHINYRKVIYDIASERRCKIIDLSNLDMSSNWGSLSMYQPDGLHPNKYGAATIANYYLSELFGIKIETSRSLLQKDMIVQSPCISLDTPYKKASCSLVNSVQVFLGGGISLNGVANTVRIARLPDGFAPKKRILITVGVFNSSSGISGTALVQIDNDGGILIYSRNISSTAEFLLFDGISYNIL